MTKDPKALKQEAREAFDPRVEVLLGILKKNHADKIDTCPDCGGFSIEFCEKGLGEVLTKYVERFDVAEKQIIDKATLAERKRCAEQIRLRVNTTREELATAIEKGI